MSYHLNILRVILQFIRGVIIIWIVHPTDQEQTNEEDSFSSFLPSFPRPWELLDKKDHHNKRFPDRSQHQSRLPQKPTRPRSKKP